MDDIGFQPIKTANEPVRAPAATPEKDDFGFKPIVTQEEPTVSHAPAEVRGDEEIGFKPIMTEAEKEAKYGTTEQMAKGLAEAFGRGAYSFIAPTIERGLGVEPEEMRAREEYLGGLGTAAEIAGFVVSPILPGGQARWLNVIGKAPKAAATALKFGPMATKMATEAVEWGAFAAGDELSKYVLKDPNQDAASAALNVGFGTVLGGAFPLGLKGVSTIWNKTAAPLLSPVVETIKKDWMAGEPLKPDSMTISPVLRNILNWAFLVPKQNIDRYVAERDAIMATPEFVEIYSNVLNDIAKADARVVEKKLSAKEAKDEFKKVIEKNVQDIKAKGFELAEAQKIAQSALKQAQISLDKSLEQSVVEDVAPSIFSALQKLRTQSMALSERSAEVLSEVPGRMSLQNLVNKIDESIEGLYREVLPERAQALEEYKQQLLAQYPDLTASFTEAKEIIKGLGKNGKWDFKATKLANDVRPFFNTFYHTLSEELKTLVPAYRKAMEPTAKSFELLNSLDKFGTPEDAAKMATKLDKMLNYKLYMPALKKLEEQTGIPFISSLEKFANPELKEQLKKELPEYADAQKAVEFLKSFRDPETRKALEMVPEFSKEAGLAQTEASEMARAEGARKALGDVTEKTLESAMKAVQAGKRGIYARKQLEKFKVPVVTEKEYSEFAKQFEKLTIKDFRNQIKDKGQLMLPGMPGISVADALELLAIRESFEKGAAIGSRNVNLWAKVIGGITGYMGGGILGAAQGTAIGAYLGSVIDKEGPAMAKKFLDFYIDNYPKLSSMLGASKDGTKSALIHFIDKGGPINLPALKATAQYFDKVKEGESLLKRSSEALLKSDKVFLKQFMPKPEKTKELDEKAKTQKDDMTAIIPLTSHMAQYLPEQGAAMTQKAARIVGLINQYRPQETPGAMFDQMNKPTKEQMRDFQVGLEIAEQPLSVYYRVANSTLLPQDIAALQALHPETYAMMKKNVMEQIFDMQKENKKVPYTLRQSLSLFLGMELDASLTPQNIQAAQRVFAAQKAQMQNLMGSAPASKTKAISKASKNYETPEQASEFRRREG